MQKLSHSGWRVDPTNGLLFCHWICHHQTMINMFKTWDWVWKGYVGLKSHQAPNISQNFVPRTLFPNGYITERYMGEDDKQYEGRSPSVEGIKTQKHNHTWFPGSMWALRCSMHLGGWGIMVLLHWSVTLLGQIAKPLNAWTWGSWPGRYNKGCSEMLQNQHELTKRKMAVRAMLAQNFLKAHRILLFQLVAKCLVYIICSFFVPRPETYKGI